MRAPRKAPANGAMSPDRLKSPPKAEDLDKAAASMAAAARLVAVTVRTRAWLEAEVKGRAGAAADPAKDSSVAPRTERAACNNLAA